MPQLRWCGCRDIGRRTELLPQRCGEHEHEASDPVGWRDRCGTQWLRPDHPQQAPRLRAQPLGTAKSEIYRESARYGAAVRNEPSGCHPGTTWPELDKLDP